MNRRWIYLIAISLIALLFLLPSLGDPLHYGDECIYLTIGNALRQGRILYRDIHDNKPPVIYILACLSFGHLAVLRLFGILSIILQLTALYFLSISISKSSSAAFILGILAVPLIIIFEGRVANGEVFMMLPITLSALLLWSWRQNLNIKRSLIIGLLLAWGFLTKAPAAFDGLGLLLATFVFLPKRPRPWRQISFWAIIAAAATPITLSLGYFAIRGGLIYYIRSALLQNIGYVSSWSGGGHQALLWRGFILILLALAIWFRRRFLSPSLIFATIWFIFALFGALLAGRPYPHYLLEIVPSLVILHAAGFASLRRQKRLFSLLIISAADALIIAVYFLFHFWWYPQIPYYRHFLTYLRGQTTKVQYYQHWGKRPLTNYRLAQFIRQTVPDNQPIFVWGSNSCIYALSGHPPVGRYTVNYHIYDYGGFGETLRALQREKPALVIKLADEKRQWPALDLFLSRYYYRLHYSRSPDIIFRRRPTSWQRLSLGFH